MTNTQSTLTFPKLIGIHGHSGVGKDTIAKYLHSTRPDTYAEAFADPLKKGCAEFFGIPLNHFYESELKEEKVLGWDSTPREILQLVGTEIIRNYHPNFWIYRMIRELTGQSNSGVEYDLNDVVVITDVRFQNEYDWLVENDAIIIHLTRPGFHGTVGIPNHQSESQINLHCKERTYEVSNDSNLDELFVKVDNIINSTSIYSQTNTENLF